MYSSKIQIDVKKSPARSSQSPNTGASPRASIVTSQHRSVTQHVTGSPVVMVFDTSRSPANSSAAPPGVARSPFVTLNAAQSPGVTRSPFVTLSPSGGKAQRVVVSPTGSPIVTVTPREAQSGSVTVSLAGATKSPTASKFSSVTKSPAAAPLHSASDGFSRSNMADKQFVDDMLKAHNQYRDKHQVAPLTLSKELCAHAQKWAEHLAATNCFGHSDCNFNGTRVGENIAMKSSSHPQDYTGQEATNQWYSEIKDHTTFGGRNPPPGRTTGHFTQVVWKGSKELGVGRAAKGNSVFVVANYRPAGNMMGDHAANVLPPRDGKIVLPPEPKNKPTRSTFSATGDFKDNSGRMGEMRKNFFSHNDHHDMAVGRGESRSMKTRTVTEGSGRNKVTKIITEETIIKANGEKIVNKTEKVIQGGSCATTGPNDHLTSHFDGIRLGHACSSSDRPDQPFAGFNNNNNSSNNYNSNTTKTFSPSFSTSSLTSSSTSCAKPSFLSTNRSAAPRRMSDFHQECLQAHNKKRALHGSGAMVLANDLSDHAQKWAEKLVSEDKFEHSPCTVRGGRVGENIACSWSSIGADYTGEQVVDQWYSEIQKHDYASDGAMNSGHFTQVVWKNSKELGVGKAKSSGGKCIVVCNYRPAGNMLGAYKHNVSPPK